MTADSQPTIQRLSSHVVDTIAAGEVIERPASVVKELVENSLDAGATRVEVVIEGGGVERIEVSDDGSGMSEADAKLCIARHATSKLRVTEDLFDIKTLGFRGEALSSIAAVSRFTLITRRLQDPAGLCIRIDGGEVVSADRVGCPPGTRVQVEDLFFNTPARRKFLKAPATEQAHVVDWALRAILGAGPGHGLVVRSGERRLVDVPEYGDFRAQILAALGRRVGELHEVDGESEGITVSGFVGEPSRDRRDTKGIWFFVNGRFVRDRTLQRALMDAYSGLLQPGRYPVAVLNIRLNPTAVDVNVHPQKLEVRFRDGAAVYRAVAGAISRVFANASFGMARRVAQRAPAPLSREGPDEMSPIDESGDHRRFPYAAPLDQSNPEGVELSDTGDRGVWESGSNLLGVLLQRYLVGQVGGDAVLVDLLAGGVGRAYDALTAEFESGRLTSVGLVLPEMFEPSETQEALLERASHRLKALGFDVQSVGPKRFALRGIPKPLEGAKPSGILATLLHELEKGSTDQGILAKLSEHAPALSTSAATELIRGLEEGATQSPRWVRRLTMAELERIVAQGPAS